jgi:hypothetical protein
MKKVYSTTISHFREKNKYTGKKGWQDLFKILVIFGDGILS